MIAKKINKTELKFENQYYVTGHYIFEFLVTYDDDSEKKIYRRYKDIRSLYKTLLLKSPGCRIPSIPSKTIWLKINIANEAQKNERKKGITEFLDYIIQHKILSKNKYVIKFFSQNEKSFSYKNNLKSEKSGNDKNNDDSDDDFDSSIMNIDDEKKEKEKNLNNISNSDDNDYDLDDIEPLDDYITEYENKNKGIVSKGKKLIGNVYNLVKNYTNNGNKKNEDGEEENNINENKDENMSSFFIKKLTKDDFEYIKQKSKNLGEDHDINDYNDKINRLNDGVKMILENFEKLGSTRKKSIYALKEIVNKDKDIIKLNNNSNNQNDLFDINENENVERKENDIDKNHKNYIKKISKYCAIQMGFLDKDFEENINKIKKHQKLLQELSDIYSRKKEHINYLGRLHSQFLDIKKQKESSDLENPVLNIKMEESEKKLKHETMFIKKLNKDLKYEIELYKKEKHKEIYELINSIYKTKQQIMKDSIDFINKENLDNEEEQKSEINNDINNINNDNKIEYLDDKKDDDFS